MKVATFWEKGKFGIKVEAEAGVDRTLLHAFAAQCCAGGERASLTLTSDDHGIAGIIFAAGDVPHAMGLDPASILLSGEAAGPDMAQQIAGVVKGAFASLRAARPKPAPAKRSHKKKPAKRVAAKTKKVGR